MKEKDELTYSSYQFKCRINGVGASKWHKGELIFSTDSG
jgi:hypothetical protein